jgi:hypothetical protein
MHVNNIKEARLTAGVLLEYLEELYKRIPEREIQQAVMTSRILIDYLNRLDYNRREELDLGE